MSWRIVFTKQAQKDARKLASAKLRPKAQRLLDVLAVNPFQNPPPYEKLVGDLVGAYSRRPAERLWANTWGWRPPARARAFALIPIIRLVGDLAKTEAPIRALKLGEVTILDAEGKPVSK